MGVDRRKFFKVAGLSALGLAAQTPVRLIAGEEHDGVTPADKSVSAALDSPCENAVCGEKILSRLRSDFERALTKEKKRWAMIVDLRRYEESDWSRSIEACREAHNIPDLSGTKDEIKWIWEEPYSHALHDQANERVPAKLLETPTLLLCNHCDDPPCVKVCPTGATFRREEDGVVMMDWHRCIGCRYCMAGCPYGSRSFNYRNPRPYIEKVNPDFPTRMRGVVEKCTFCDERLARGQLPACVEACKTGMLMFGDLSDPGSLVNEVLDANFTVRRKPGLGTHPEVYYIV